MDNLHRVIYSRAPVSVIKKKRTAQVVPILLAAGPSPRLPFPRALAPFGKKTALAIAVENCAGLAQPIVVLGRDAPRVRRVVPPGVRVVVNRRWRAGQLSSLLAALRHIVPGAAALIYPVDHPLLTAKIVRRLVIEYRRRRPNQTIVLPVFHRRFGHPVIFAPELRRELYRARTAREVVYRDPQRVRMVRFATPAIWLDFDSPASYRRCLRTFLRRRPAVSSDSTDH